MKTIYLFLEINKTEFIANKVIRAIEARVDHVIKDRTESKAIDDKFSVSSKAIYNVNSLHKIATMEGLSRFGMECFISIN